MRSWTDEELIEAVKTSTTKADVLRKIGLTLAGSYKMLSAHIARLNLDISHFKSTKDILTTARLSKRKELSLDELLISDGYYYDSHLVKKKLLKEKVLKYECTECKLTEWRNKSISLQLDHINGERCDNRLENLRLLCPNCHSQTDTFSGKKTRKNKKENHCLNCKKPILIESVRCKSCTSKLTKNKIKWPEIEVLVQMISSSNFLKTARVLGVSDNSIRKHLKNHGIDLKPRRKL